MLFNAWQASRELPDLGAIPTIILIVIGFLGSKFLVSALWKMVTKKSYRIAIVASLLPTYFLSSVVFSLLTNAWDISQSAVDRVGCKHNIPSEYHFKGINLVGSEMCLSDNGVFTDVAILITLMVCNDCGKRWFFVGWYEEIRGDDFALFTFVGDGEFSIGDDVKLFAF